MGSILWSETKQEKWLMLCICSVLTMISCALNFYNIFISVCGIFEKEVFNYRPEILELECIYYISLCVLPYCKRMNVELEFST